MEMRLPKMSRRASRELIIPELFGGINLRDSVSMINDNQLTDCLNMWKQDGFLKTRPGFKERELVNTDFKERYAGKYRQHGIFMNYGGERLQLVSLPILSNTSGKIQYIQFFLVSSDYDVIMPECSCSGKAAGYFVAEKDGYIYCFLDDGNFSIKKCKFSVYCIQGGKKNEYSGEVIWESVTDEERYIPLVMAHCKPKGRKHVSTDEVDGTMIEGYNLLSDYYKIIYNSFNGDLIKSDGGTHMMVYHLPESVSKQKYVGKEVTVKYTSSAGTVTHTIPITTRHSDNVESRRTGDDGIEVHVFSNRVWLYSDETHKEIYIDDGGIDDIEITAPYIWDDSDKEKIFKMRECEWFGGGTAGLAGGTRLFLCGSSKESDKNLVVWSGLNNPLYFPENSYFRVGSASGAVKGFGKQSDKLIIFKENETWSTEYYQNTEITAEDVINQTVVDYATSSAYFPLSQINPNVGCPYPDTVQLCRNRLCWLAADKSVCTLVSESGYTERSIYTVSEMVQRKLNTESADYVSAADWNGYYCLFFGDRMYLMDYNCYGYNYIASYSKTEDANLKIPWYCWELPSSGQAMICIDGKLGIVTEYDTDINVGFFDISLDKDYVQVSEGLTPKNIISHFTTKLFEFSAPHIRKNIEAVNIQTGANGGEPINIQFITESGRGDEAVTLYGDTEDSRSADYVENRAVFPCMRNILRFGIKCECEGNMAVDGIVIKYRFTGGAR